MKLPIDIVLGYTYQLDFLFKINKIPLRELKNFSLEDMIKMVRNFYEYTLAKNHIYIQPPCGHIIFKSIHLAKIYMSIVQGYTYKD